MIEYQTATAIHGHGMREVALSVSKENLLQQGFSIDQLKNQGWLHYPIEAENYSDRAEKGHCHVALDNETVVAFIAAYTFEQMQKFKSPTSTDLNILKYFLEHMRCNPKSLYISQVGTHPEYKRQGHMASLLRRLFNNLSAENKVIAISEIAYNNNASQGFFTREGFVFAQTRERPDPSSESGTRLSKTYLRTLANLEP